MNQQDTDQIFKGMQRFRYVRSDVLLDDAMQSPYFWWWTYLRLSKDYWWTCVRKGMTDDPRLRSMYRDFGDVFSMTFEDWWRSKGITYLLNASHHQRCVNLIASTCA